MPRHVVKIIYHDWMYDFRLSCFMDRFGLGMVCIAFIYTKHLPTRTCLKNEVLERACF